jgi:hypothetical protein
MMCWYEESGPCGRIDLFTGDPCSHQWGVDRCSQWMPPALVASVEQLRAAKRSGRIHVHTGITYRPARAKSG